MNMSQIMTPQRPHTTNKWPPYATEWTPPWKFYVYATDKSAQYMKKSWLIVDRIISTTVIYIGFVCEFLLSPWMYRPWWESFYKREQWECCCYRCICKGEALH